MSILISGGGFVFSKVNGGIRLPLAIDTALPMLLFYAIGSWMRSKEVLNKAKDFSFFKKVILLVSTGGVCLVCFLINGDTNVRQIQFGNPLLYVIGATVGCLVMILFSMMICDFKLSKYKVFQSLLYIGQGTLIILYVHRVYIGIIRFFIMPRLPFLNQYIVFVLFTIVFFIIFAYPSCIIINKYFPFIIGKKYE